MAQELGFDSSSSNIASVRFDIEEGAETGSLTVQFKKGGAVYRYAEVPMSVYQQMYDAEQEGSCGSFFHANVRSSYSFEKVSG